MAGEPLVRVSTKFNPRAKTTLLIFLVLTLSLVIAWCADNIGRMRRFAAQDVETTATVVALDPKVADAVVIAYADQQHQELRKTVPDALFAPATTPLRNLEKLPIGSKVQIKYRAAAPTDFHLVIQEGWAEWFRSGATGGMLTCVTFILLYLVYAFMIA